MLVWTAKKRTRLAIFLFLCCLVILTSSPFPFPSRKGERQRTEGRIKTVFFHTGPRPLLVYLYPETGKGKRTMPIQQRSLTSLREVNVKERVAKGEMAEPLPKTKARRKIFHLKYKNEQNKVFILQQKKTIPFLFFCFFVFLTVVFFLAIFNLTLAIRQGLWKRLKVKRMQSQRNRRNGIK